MNHKVTSTTLHSKTQNIYIIKLNLLWRFVLIRLAYVITNLKHITFPKRWGKGGKRIKQCTVYTMNREANRMFTRKTIENCRFYITNPCNCSFDNKTFIYVLVLCKNMLKVISVRTKYSYFIESLSLIIANAISSVMLLMYYQSFTILLFIIPKSSLSLKLWLNTVIKALQNSKDKT